MTYKGIVLAGGKSSRFGQDKATAKIKGITLLEKAVQLLKDLKLEPTVITNGARDYSFLHCRIEQDLIPDQGPLGGLYAACRKFPAHSLLVLTCDMPGVTLESLRMLLQHRDCRKQVTLFKKPDGRFQPFPGIYESALSELLLKNIEKGMLSVQHFLGSLPKIHAVSHDLDPSVLFNINVKKDLKLWLNFL